MVGVSTLLESVKRGIETEQVTFTTTTLAGNTTHDIKLGSNDDKIDSVTYKPDDATPPSEGLLLLIRPVADSGTTDSDIFIHEDSSRADIDEVTRIENLSVDDASQTFQPGTGEGIQFQNQDGDDEMFLRIVENSGIDSVYTIRLRWFNVT